ncbi:WD40 repeat-like protein [Coprinopsis marcescibilis]|uniref:WD40 repeat-like protein n=1 Tax=Coprinopsis marcescibilis TaxID=230819 RepID=A0A5C3L422_COPMA|nr:WD40 repeat-like protein [Coprinopsis marcescibilis]
MTERLPSGPQADLSRSHQVTPGGAAGSQINSSTSNVDELQIPESETDDPPWARPQGPVTCTHNTTKDGRNLIICIDGTSNKFGEKNTNVIGLYNLILKNTGDGQRTWYNSGIGTYVHTETLSHSVRLMIDLAFARSFKQTVIGAYRWLCDMYEDGDCIFLFGFSRGALQARALSAMIAKVGLLYKGNELQIPFAYKLYTDSDSDNPRDELADPEEPGRPGQARTMAQWFKKAFSREVIVHFVGAWETVSSIGSSGNRNLPPGTIQGMHHVCFFRHALALDERRVRFLPEYAWGGTHAPPAKVPAQQQISETPEEIPQADSTTEVKGALELHEWRARAEHKQKEPVHTLEVWFSGTHSDIGGGRKKNASMSRSTPPLRWMVSEAEAAGLRTAGFKRELQPHEQIELSEDSLKGFLWRFLEILPLKRLTFTRRPEGKEVTRKPHLGSSRKIHHGQKIHSSFILGEDQKGYIPKARPPDVAQNDEAKQFWGAIYSDGLMNKDDWLEIDLVQYVKTLVKKFIDGNGNSKDSLDKLSLETVAKYTQGLQIVYAEVVEVIKKRDKVPEIKRAQLVAKTMELFGTFENDAEKIKPEPLFLIHRSMMEMMGVDGGTYDAQIQAFMQKYTNMLFRFEFRAHTELVWSVAFTADGKKVVSASSDRTIRRWDARKGAAIGEPFKGHKGKINALALASFDDETTLFSASEDATIRVWDVKTGKQRIKPLVGHKDWVRALAVVKLTQTGVRIVSGSDDMTVRIWDWDKGTELAKVGESLKGHTGYVLAVAVSADGRQIVSGSSDSTIRIWDMDVDAAASKPLELRGHKAPVRSVAILDRQDGNRIVVSGSEDGTIRIWNAETGKEVRELRGHKGSVRSIYIDPDHKHIVSGSTDKSIRIWDLETGKTVCKPLVGHKGSVYSVVVSPDGQWIASASVDTTVRIWDMKVAMADKDLD